MTKVQVPVVKSDLRIVYSLYPTAVTRLKYFDYYFKEVVSDY